jgi:hypothetical protein
MPTPTNRTPVRVARGTYSNLNTNKADIQEGEICYATDQDKLYVKEGSNLVDASTTDITGKADLASPTFTGVPAAPTATGGNNTTQLATTAFVNAEITGKADSASPTFTGTPAAPTAALGTNTTQIATTEFVEAATAALADSAPAALNTLNELAAALGDDANFSTTVTNSIATKLPLAGGTLTGNLVCSEALSIERVTEKVDYNSSGAATGTINLDVKSQAITWDAANATGNFAINIRGDGSTTLNSLMTDNQSLTTAYVVAYGSTAYYPTGVTVDGASATVKWAGGAPSGAETASSITSYTLTAIKTADATFTVLVSSAAFE